MSKRDHDERASVNTFQAAQHVLGINILELARWAWLALAGSWVWTGDREGGQGLPDESPLIWFGRLVEWAGWKPTWPQQVDTWLTDHPTSFWPLVVVSVLAVGRSIDGGAHYTSFALMTLLAAASIHGGEAAMYAYVALSGALCITAVAADLASARSTQHSSYPEVAMPTLSVTRWLYGPMKLLAVLAVAPLALIAVGTRAYRTTPEPASVNPFALAHEARSLGKGSLAEAPAEDVVAVLAHAQLMAQDDEHRSTAMWALQRRRETPSGARPLR